MVDVSGAIDNLTEAVVNTVAIGAQVTAGILEYLRDNYLTALAGLVVVGLLISRIPRTNMGTNFKKMF